MGRLSHRLVARVASCLDEVVARRTYEEPSRHINNGVELLGKDEFRVARFNDRKHEKDERVLCAESPEVQGVVSPFAVCHQRSRHPSSAVEPCI